jgi:hypothetical protein
MDIFRKKCRELSDEEKDNLNAVKTAAEIYYGTLHEAGVKHPIDSRYMALARTAIEESVMWATKSITA